LKAILKNTAKDIFVYLILCAAVFLMLKIITEHFTLKSDVGFLAAKQAYVNNNIWRTAFYIHVFTSIFTLLAGFTQFSSYVLKEHRTLHRILGRIYVIAVLFINFPSGMILAFNANGELPTRIAFIILDSLWFWFTLKAFVEIRKGNITAHRKFMIRSYALTFSAITLRLWKLILSNSFTFDPATLYMIDAWLGFVPNLLFAEWYISRNINRKQESNGERER